MATVPVPLPAPTVVAGGNADLIAQVAEGYLKPNAVVCDMTYGKAALWGADLGGADLREANLEKAGLGGANLSAVVNLTQDQLNTACTDKDTQLPESLK